MEKSLTFFRSGSEFAYLFLLISTVNGINHYYPVTQIQLDTASPPLGCNVRGLG